MVGTSKVLTVSYGTFSCTLEGFDEPFSTMKAIVEYFRELAEADRQFGAEIPKLDTETLHRIAERGFRGRVEAEVTEEGIVLRALGKPEPAAEAAPEADPDSVQTKMARLRAVIATAPETAAPAQSPFEDEAEAPAATADDPGDQASRSPADTPDAEDEGDEAAEAAPEAPPEGALDLAAWRTDDPLPAAASAEEPPQDDPEPEPEERSFFERARARVVDIRQAQESAPGHDDELRTAISAAMTGDAADAEDEASEAPEDDEALIAGIGATIGGSGLDADAEADLVRELASVAREVRRDGHEGRAILEGTSRDEEASVRRLMEEAKSKLEGDESRRRFSAISHLKAAVAATVADRKLKSPDQPGARQPAAATDLDRYREDLSKAVRPRRIGAVLFKRKQDDDDIHAEATPVSAEDARNFAEFAERLGARGLPELLEAAAAYTATVEGQPHFSRPHILRKVAKVAENEDYSREDRLRSFGLLLRQGKLQKISRGQFTITEASRFMPKPRSASH